MPEPPCPYLFAQIDAKKAALTEQGIDAISLGIGDPDTPTPAAHRGRHGRGHPQPREPPATPIAPAGSRADPSRPAPTGCSSQLRRGGWTRPPRCSRSSAARRASRTCTRPIVDPGDWVLAPVHRLPGVLRRGHCCRARTPTSCPCARRTASWPTSRRCPPTCWTRRRSCSWATPTTPPAPAPPKRTSTPPSRSASSTTCCSRTTTPTATSASTATARPPSWSGRMPRSAASSSSACRSPTT